MLTPWFIIIQGRYRAHEFIQWAGALQVGSLIPFVFGPEKPLETFDFTDLGGGDWAPVAPLWVHLCNC